MKKIFNLQSGVFLLSLMIFSLIQQTLFAQDSSASKTTSSTSVSTTTIQPWVWVVGGVVLLIIIIALVSKGSSRSGIHTDKVTYTKTTSSEDN
ncbi:MAG TPA: hypothetical protein VNS50_12020 [Ginsengibacter sp.]|nr:hypothetical protein [Ginsengibacter sp.]